MSSCSHIAFVYLLKLFVVITSSVQCEHFHTVELLKCKLFFGIKSHWRCESVKMFTADTWTADKISIVSLCCTRDRQKLSHHNVRANQGLICKCLPWCSFIRSSFWMWCSHPFCYCFLFFPFFWERPCHTIHMYRLGVKKNKNLLSIPQQYLNWKVHVYTKFVDFWWIPSEFLVTKDHIFYVSKIWTFRQIKKKKGPNNIFSLLALN